MLKNGSDATAEVSRDCRRTQSLCSHLLRAPQNDAVGTRVSVSLAADITRLMSGRASFDSDARVGLGSAEVLIAASCEIVTVITALVAMSWLNTL